jgi:hypothetical protein
MVYHREMRYMGVEPGRDGQSVILRSIVCEWFVSTRMCMGHEPRYLPSSGLTHRPRYAALKQDLRADDLHFALSENVYLLEFREAETCSLLVVRQVDALEQHIRFPVQCGEEPVSIDSVVTQHAVATEQL